MRKILFGLAAISFFISCNSDQKTETTKEVVGMDSSALPNNTMADTAHFAPVVPAPVAIAPEKVAEPAPKPKVITKYKYITKPAPTTAKSNTVTPAPVSTPAPVTPAAGTTGTTPEAQPEKKGWSNAAKGATIGGVGGAIGGAILSKKKGKGAIIGGAIGAAGGYILGRKKDKAQQAKDTTQ